MPRLRPLEILWYVAAAMRLALCLLALATVVAAPRAARACSCMPPPSPTQAAERATAVFEGRTFGVSREGEHNRFTFEVTRVWKGDVSGRVDVWSHSQSATCGRGFEAGTSYVVYAESREGRLVDGLCSRTREVARASEDVESLGPARPPTDPATPLPQTGPQVEPPRIEARDPAVPPTAPHSRGCTLGDRDDALAPLVALAFVARRRARRRLPRFPSKEHQT